MNRIRILTGTYVGQFELLPQISLMYDRGLYARRSVLFAWLIFWIEFYVED